MKRSTKPRRFEPVPSPAFLFTGQGLRLWYPAQNRFGLPLEYIRRHIIVERVLRIADFELGISAELIKSDPLQRWGCWRVDGIDYKSAEPVSLYWEAMHQEATVELPWYQLAFRDIATGDCDRLGCYGPNKRDRLRMRDAVLKWEGRKPGFELVGFPVPSTRGGK